MLNKAFKPPLLRKSNSINERQTDAPLVKRRRISKENEADDASASLHKGECRSHAPPLNHTNQLISARKSDDDSGETFRGYYTVLWYLPLLYLQSIVL